MSDLRFHDFTVMGRPGLDPSHRVHAISALNSEAVQVFARILEQDSDQPVAVHPQWPTVTVRITTGPDTSALATRAAPTRWRWQGGAAR